MSGNLDLTAIILDLHRMRLELESIRGYGVVCVHGNDDLQMHLYARNISSMDQAPAAVILQMFHSAVFLEKSLESPEETLVTRHGSVRGRKLHVFNTMRVMRLKIRWQRDYIEEEMNTIVVYITTCGILRRVWERCRNAVELLKALKIKVEFRDLYIDPSYADELTDRMCLEKSNRELVYDGLPLVYVNGKYFGNDTTLIQENENKNLADIFREFQGRQECTTCYGSGYVVCSYCRGGKKVQETFRVRLRCARCDRNGIAPCPRCSPHKL